MKTELENLLRYHPIIHVSQEAIDHSRQKNKFWCIVNRSICYTIPGVTRVNVDVHLTRFTLRGFRLTYKTPTKAAIIAHDLDKYGKRGFDGTGFKPTKFAMGLPLGVVPVIHQSRSRPTNVKSGIYRGQKTCTARYSIRWNGLALPPRLAKLIEKRNRHASLQRARRAARAA